MERVPPAGGGCGGDTYRIKPGFVEWERFFPSSVRAFGPATFPVGEGFLRRGLSYFYSTVVTSVTVLAMVLKTL